MIHLFTKPWWQVPTVWLDTETTGVHPGTDRVVQLGLCRIERGEVVGTFESLVNPGIPIPEVATKVHKITDDHVANAPRIEDVFAMAAARELLEGAQLGGYNANFDRLLVLPYIDWMWPWLDPLPLVRKADKWVKGEGKNKLEKAAARYGVELTDAHSALADARAAGLLFYEVAEHFFGRRTSLGHVLAQLRHFEADEWFGFNDWLARQPPKEARNG